MIQWFCDHPVMSLVCCCEVADMLTLLLHPSVVAFVSHLPKFVHAWLTALQRRILFTWIQTVFSERNFFFASYSKKLNINFSSVISLCVTKWWEPSRTLFIFSLLCNTSESSACVESALVLALFPCSFQPILMSQLHFVWLIFQHSGWCGQI